jgi:UDP-glucose 4-epimerase
MDVVVLDDLSHGRVDSIAHAELVAGRECQFIRGSITDPAAVYWALEGVDVVCHLAAFKNVGASSRHPGRYFANNVGGMAVLLEQMERRGVRRIINSSSAAVYGTQTEMPLLEDAPMRPDSPYGVTKQLGEQMLDEMTARHGWSAVSLRYFNPVGAHPSGLVGEPLFQADSLVARTLQALVHPDRPLTIYGTDYDTPDGTCQRDFVHVCDLSRAHLAAMQALEQAGHHVFNVGTGRPYSVRQVIEACAEAAGRPVPHVEGARRVGDIPVAVADCERFRSAHGFEARLSLQEMVTSAWAWSVRHADARKNPSGGHSLEAARARVRDDLGAHWPLGLTA